MPPCKVASAADYEVVPVKEEVSTSTTGHSDNEKALASPTPHYDPIMKGLYLATTYLSFGMVWWIMIAPASWLIGRSWFHREVLIPYLVKQNFAFLIAPESIITKYQGHDLIHLTHLIPAAIWSAIIPFQLHPTWRNNNRKLHRFLGYVFLASSFLVAVGVFIILHRKLTYENYFPDLQPDIRHEVQKPAMAAMSLWFFYTAVEAVRMAKAKKIQLHQKWMYRHVASAIWIAVQRMVCFPIVIVYFKLRAEQPSQWAQREIFAAAAELSWVLCACLGEYAHRRASNLRMSPQKKRE